MDKEPIWQWLDYDGKVYTLVGIGETNNRQIKKVRNIDKYMPVKDWYPDDGSAPSIMSESDAALQERLLSGIGNDVRKYPFDLRLESIIQTKVGPNSTGSVVRRPFNSDDMTTSTDGVWDPETAKQDELHKKDNNVVGVSSIMNRFAITTLKGAYTNEIDKMHSLIDTPGKRRWYEDFNFGDGGTDNANLNHDGYSKTPTVSSLISFGLANKRGTTPYNYSDFAYCKYFNKIPNNYLITLRRFAVPTFDSLMFPFVKDDVIPPPTGKEETQEERASREKQNKESADSGKTVIDEDMKAPPIAQAVTWLGSATDNTIEALTSFTTSLTWSELKAELWSNTESAGSYSADADSGMPGWLKGFGKSMSVMSGSAETWGGSSHSAGTPPDPYENGPYANRILGPVNRIQTVKKRDAPLDFKHSITLNFHYVARSIGGINAKAAMLDIIANFLVLTYGVGAFWGGAVRHMGGGASNYPWKKGMAAWYAGDPGKFFEAIADSVASVADKLSSLFDNLFSDPIGTLKSLASNGVAGIMALKNKNRQPMLAGMRSILTGEPTGPWHLVIGNPLNPIMMIGNLVCENCTFKFNNELGPDDFPTEMTVTVTLSHAMPRDRYSVESMFNKGYGRIYTLPDIDENTLAGNKESKVDAYTGDKNPYLNKIMGVSKLGEGTGSGSGNHGIYRDRSGDFDKAIKSSTSIWDSGTKLARNMESHVNKPPKK